MRTFNIRLAVIVLAILAVFIASVYYLHGYQLHRNAYVFKREADRAQARAKKAAKAKDTEAEKSAFKQAVENLTWYVRLVPDDIDAVEHLGMILADKAEDSRTFSRRSVCWNACCGRIPRESTSAAGWSTWR